jgi:predicted phage terminase large subunit-like protein
LALRTWADQLARESFLTTKPGERLPPPSLALLDFAARVRAGYEIARHIALLAAALEWLVATPGAVLVIVMPPRHGKSLLSSVLFPAWLLGNYPWLRVIAVSHGASLAYFFSRLARNLFESFAWPFPSVRLAKDRGSVSGWDIAGERGGYIAAGVGGSVTGVGADVLIIDDAIRSRADAESETKRESTWEWFQSTALPRLEPGGRLVLIGTRWHHDDLIGRFLNELPATNARVLHLAATALDPETDDLERETGEPLWPERFDAAALAETKRRVGTRTWNAEYQGMPSEEEGAILHAAWFLRYTRPPDGILWTLASLDTAFKVGAGNDYTAATLWGVTTAGAVLLDAVRDQFEYPELVRFATNYYLSWRPRYFLIEDKGSGQSLYQSLLAGSLRIPAIAVPVPSGAGKEERVHEIAPFIESGRVVIPQHAPWLDEWLNEVTEFPFGAYDDYVDSTSQALARIFASELGAGRSETVDYRKTSREDLATRRSGARWRTRRSA